jgi:hypothetical protein
MKNILTNLFNEPIFINSDCYKFLYDKYYVKYLNKTPAPKKEIKLPDYINQKPCKTRKQTTKNKAKPFVPQKQIGLKIIYDNEYYLIYNSKIYTLEGKYCGYINDKIIINNIDCSINNVAATIESIKEHIMYLKDNLYIDNDNNIYKKYGNFYFIIGIFINDISYFYEDDTESVASDLSNQL